MGISKQKELQQKLNDAQKQITQLEKMVSEKNQTILNLNKEIADLNSKQLFAKKFNSEKLKKDNTSNSNSSFDIVPKIGNVSKNFSMESNIQNFEIIEDGGDHTLEEENILLKEKIKKMKEAIVTLSKKLDNELLLKEQKSMRINENNSRLFEELNKKNKELVKKIKELNLINRALYKEKYDLETICLRQEDRVKLLNKKLAQSAKKYDLNNQKSEANIYVRDCAKNEMLLPKIYARNNNNNNFGANKSHL